MSRFFRLGVEGQGLGRGHRIDGLELHGSSDASSWWLKIHLLNHVGLRDPAYIHRAIHPYGTRPGSRVLKRADWFESMSRFFRLGVEGQGLGRGHRIDGLEVKIHLLNYCRVVPEFCKYSILAQTLKTCDVPKFLPKTCDIALHQFM
ncbi:hypothetical protein F2Q70_00014962 [Brassica cretica]|uniref:Uncharacterized protein n=1 Tax=Brassica cretica TaxID=69181 RepID=A0A8S9HY28_BRACR|nr:hypothetical protein F2Q70_00014962 [Brassica cretica]